MTIDRPDNDGSGDDGSDADDELLAYHLGGGPEDDDGADDTDDRGTRRGALIGLAVVTAVVALAITLTGVLVDTSPGGAPTSPQAAVQRWSSALVRGDDAQRHALECAAGSRTGDVLAQVLVSPTAAHAGTTAQQAADRWTVALSVDGPDGSPEQSGTITVVRESGRYLIC